MKGGVAVAAATFILFAAGCTRLSNGDREVCSVGAGGNAARVFG